MTVVRSRRWYRRRILTTAQQSAESARVGGAVGDEGTMGRETMDEDGETEVNARRTSSPPAPYDEPPPAQLDDSFVATFRQCKIPESHPHQREMDS
jgi:hypothetical protein